MSGTHAARNAARRKRCTAREDQGPETEQDELCGGPPELHCVPPRCLPAAQRLKELGPRDSSVTGDSGFRDCVYFPSRRYSAPAPTRRAVVFLTQSRRDFF